MKLVDRLVLREHQWNALAAAGQNHDVGTVVKRIHLLVRHVSQQRYWFLEAALSNTLMDPS